MNNYRSNNELRYFGSDLNKFINQNCKSSKEGFVIINIDCITQDYKIYPKRLRIIESKHIKEEYPYAQKSILKLFSECFNFLKQISDYNFEFYLIRGDYPYNIIYIYDVNENLKSVFKNKKDFIKWLNFEIEI